MNDEPKWEDSAAIQKQRANDHLKTGDVIQEWRAQVGKDHRAEWGWRDGDVLAVVESSCDGVAWVALIQWHAGEEVKDWTALPQIDWRVKGAMLRRKP